MIALFIRLNAVLAAALGLVALAGWVFDIALFKSVLPGAVEMKANTAVGLVMAAGALIISGDRQLLRLQPRLRYLGLTLALSVGALGVATLGEYAFGWQLGIDELLFLDTAGAYNLIRGRMSPYSALAFACAGLALAVLPWPRLQLLARSATSVVTGIGVVSLLGYLWNAHELVTDRWLPPVAVHTAVAFILLGIGALLASFKSASSTERDSTAGSTANSTTLTPAEVKIMASFIGAVLLLSLGGGLTYRAAAESANSAQRVAHSQEVRAVLSRLYADITGAESAQRNYLITGQQPQLQRYGRLTGESGSRQEALARLVADNPAQLQNAAELKRLGDRFIELLARGIALYQQQGFAAARDMVASGQGFEVVQTIRALIERMDASEQKLLAEREAVLTTGSQLTLVALLLTLLAAMWIFAYVFSSIRREMAARSEAEQALREAKSAADLANRAKSTFLATMSHEIRTPMNGMFGMLELLSLTQLSGEQRTKVEIVRESGKSLLRIIDDILDFSKIEAGKLDVRPEITSIREVIESVRNLFTGSASSKGLMIECSVNPEISPAVLVDPLRLRQILNNFVSNALKFSPRGGNVAIKAELIERVDGKDRVRFSVKDTGIGISAANQQRLFQPFSQGEGDTTRRYGGTGLGLTICLRLAEMMGGTIEMASEVGKGTTMILNLTLPIADPKFMFKTDHGSARGLPITAPLMRRPAPSVVQAEAEGTLVLLVDDHPSNRNILMRQMLVLGYAVVGAKDGIDALDKWKSGRFALVITDCHMPEMDGYELTHCIRELESGIGGKRTPIIACTANALGGEAEMCLAAGMDDYIVKPVELSQLVEKLDRWLPIPAVETASNVPSNESDAPPPDTAVAAPVDYLVLAEISGGKSVEVRDILINFRRFNDDDTAMLKRAVAASDMHQVAHAAHRIKGASLMIGAWALAEVCERIERAGRANDLTAVAGSMDAFHHESMRLSAYFDTL